MSKIALRAYNREIEAMIDRGQAKRAIVHCRHILKYFPKHIDTYRLLGKAFLETQRYAEASDVLQRVLSAVPDDFISQIGLSIIREDEGNLDAAIWHMERAFEAQPSNSAVQEELRRLYARRDGVQPPKIRLTRGALVRMYARGELFQQAIAEIRVALAEDPQRLDLEVILARMYFLSGQTIPSTEVCSRLVGKLPYCFEANRILAEILPGTSRAEDAESYKKRVYAMDPYLEHVPANGSSSLDAPENSVFLDELEYDEGEETSKSPEWTQNLGLDWKQDSETLPDWFSAIKPEDESPELAEEATTKTTPQRETPSPMETRPLTDLTDDQEGEEVPDWMKEAGWSKSDNVPPEAEAGYNLEEPAEEPVSDDIQPGQLPEWLSGVAPEENPDDTHSDEIIHTGELDFLKDILSEETQDQPVVEENETASQEASSLVEDRAAPEETPAGETIPVSVDDVSSPEDTEQISPIDGSELPDWLTEMIDEAKPDQPAGNNVATAPEEQAAEPLQIPEETEAPAEKAPIQAETETNLEAELLEDTAEVKIRPDESTGEEAGLAESGEAPGFSSPEAEDLSSTSDMDEAMAWLESLAAAQGADEATLLTKPEERKEQAPEWLQDLEQTEEAATPLEEATEQPTAENEIAETPIEETESLEATPPSDTDQPISLEPTIAAETATLAVEPEPEVEQTSSEIKNEQEISVPTEVTESPGEEKSPTEGDIEMPDWIKAVAEEEELPEDSENEVSEDQLPDWLRELEAETDQEENPIDKVVTEATGDEAQIAPSEELLSLETTTGEVESVIEEAEPVASDEVITEETEEQGSGEIVEETIPDTEPEVSQVESAPEEPEETEAPHGEEEPAPSELEQLEEFPLVQDAAEITETVAEEAETDQATEASSDSEDLIPTAAPEEDLVPEWLKDLAIQEDTQDEAAPPDISEEAVPDWLEKLGSEGSQEAEEPAVTSGWMPESQFSAATEPEPSPAEISPEETPVSETQPANDQVLLQNAQSALEAYNIERALDNYNRLIQHGVNLEETIHDLRDALYRYPIDIAIWQALGDAYMRSNRLQEALDAYTKAEELLR